MTLSSDASNHAECKGRTARYADHLLDACRRLLAEDGQCLAMDLVISRQERYGESQGVTLSSDRSNHAECKTLGIIFIACDNDSTDASKRSQARV